MPSHKKFNDKMCVYCATEPATTEDHVFARGFFVEARRDNPAAGNRGGAHRRAARL